MDASLCPFSLQVYKFSAADVPDEALFSAIVTKMAQKNTRA